MLDMKSTIIGVLFGIVLVFSFGASHKKERMGPSPCRNVSALCHPQ